MSMTRTVRGARVFPLLLTGFEKLMLLDDLPQSPSSIIVQWELAGSVDRTAFDAALEAALRRHPMLCVVLGTGKRNRPSWVLAPHLRPRVDWACRGTAFQELHEEHLDLKREVGLRLWVRQSDNHTQLTFQFHHACTDGIGAYRFASDLLALYGIHLTGGGDAPTVLPLNPVLLRNRARRLLHGPAEAPPLGGAWLAQAGVKRLTFYRSGLSYLLKNFVRSVTPLRPPRTSRTHVPPAFPGIVYADLDRAQQLRLRTAAARLGVTSNDLLIAALFGTLGQYNRRRKLMPFAQRYRILVSSDLRARGDEFAPAANYVGGTMLTRTARQCSALRKLLRSVHCETVAARHRHMGTQFTRAVVGADHIPGLLTAVTRWRRSCYPTVVLANLGKLNSRWTARFPQVRRCVASGNLVLEHNIGVGPLQAHTHATVGIGVLGPNLTICVRCDPGSFDQQASQQFLDAYVARIQAYIDLGQPHASRPLDPVAVEWFNQESDSNGRSNQQDVPGLPSGGAIGDRRRS